MSQPRISNELGATVFAILAGLAALFLTAWIFTSGGCSDRSASPTLIAAAPEDSSLQGDLDEAEAQLAEESARRAELAAELRAQREANASLRAELAKLDVEPAVDLAAEATPDDLASRLAASEERNLSLVTENEELAARVVLLEGEKEEMGASVDGGDSTVAKVASLTAALAAAKAATAAAEKDRDSRIAKLEAELEAAKKASMSASADGEGALADLRGKLEAAEKAASDQEKSLSAKIAELEAKLKAGMSASEEEGGALAKLQAEFDAAKKAAGETEASLTAKVAELEAKLKASMTASEEEEGAPLAKLQEQLASIQAKLDASLGQEKQLKAQIEELRGKIQAVQGREKQLQAQVGSLKMELGDSGDIDDGVKAGVFYPDLELPFFANRPVLLNRDLRPLFVRLRGIEDTATAREKLYRELADEGNALPLDTVSFERASITVTADEAADLAAKMKGGPKDAKYLVVGYASVDGDPASNYRLSASRASQVAEELAELTGLGEDSIQAVDFGQTQRFDAKNLAPNRIVEVWRLK
ncbi:MAG: OmpA family protein [Verrucomicrobiota bacterium]